MSCINWRAWISVLKISKIWLRSPMRSPLSMENMCLTPIWSRRGHRTRNSSALSIVRSVSRPCTIRIPCRSHDRRSTYLCLSDECS
ncbi:hypothetical protein I7I53_07988 [Histoplasma capsulatum var. duboisii H88]|uniref:Uncharacterized protein n=1 Tax=Ajellomyces capsulatus (strain H88) TaxID=544711 RepID=A0A8A1LK56_AJEC8|nr:hypothetical protein I7I53_07988 [Histoplasma capsulatum var. duboisii H88]